MRIRFYLTSLLSLLILPLAALGEETVRIGGSNTLSILPKIALEQGFFAAEGIKVEYSNIQIGKLAMDAVVSEQVDFGIVVDSNLAFDSFRDSNLRAVASIIEYYGNGFAFNKTKLASIEQLSGKRIGYLPATTSHLFLLRLLETQQLTMKDIVPVVLQPPGMLPALRSEVVDAVSIWVPWRTEILRALPEVTEEGSNPLIYPSRGYLATTASFLAKRPEAAQKVLKALSRAEQYIEVHQQETAVRYANWNGMQQDVVDQLWKIYRPRITYGEEVIEVVQEDIRLIQKFDPIFAAKSSRVAEQLFDFTAIKKLEQE